MSTHITFLCPLCLFVYVLHKNLDHILTKYVQLIIIRSFAYKFCP